MGGGGVDDVLAKGEIIYHHPNILAHIASMIVCNLYVDEHNYRVTIVWWCFDDSERCVTADRVEIVNLKKTIITLKKISTCNELIGNIHTLFALTHTHTHTRKDVYRQFVKQSESGKSTG